ncbi:sugar transporter [Gymnodinialimonas sp.]
MTEAAKKPDAPVGAKRRIRVNTVPAGRAKMRWRHWGILISFVVLVLAPIAVLATYLYTVAVDQYASTTGFTVRQNESSAATDVLGGLAAFTGGGGSGQADADILFEYIVSQELVQRLDARLDLVGHYSAPFEEDPFFALDPDTTIEGLVDHWQRIVRISYSQSSGLMELRVLAFEPGMAQAIASAIIEESQSLVNALNSTARDDAMRFAEQDLAAALVRLRTAREALTAFRTRTQIVDPESDLQGRMGVLNNLQQQLAEALIENDLLGENTANPNDPRLRQSAQRIDVIRERIALERQNFTEADAQVGGEDYPTLIAEFEGLVVDREFAEESYRAALTALDLARTNTTRQSRYLAVFIQPTFPELAQFPRRDVILGLAALFLVLSWAILALVYYSIRDRQ